MKDSAYQKDFSAIAPRVLDEGKRIEKTLKMTAVLGDAGVLPSPPRGIAVDVGCSGGFFVRALAPFFERAVGIDIDESALRFARNACEGSRAAFVLGDSQRFPFPDASIDLVVCNHVYEHVPDAQVLFGEIWRVLRPGAVCYLGAASRLTPVEPHYKLPFLSWLPKFLANPYMRWTGRGDRYYENLRTWWGIRRLIRKFELTDYTLRVLSDPDLYHARDMIPKGGLADRIPKRIWTLLYPLLPSYILLLRRPATPGQARK
jgi:SAM-dependent methyltransferase